MSDADADLIPSGSVDRRQLARLLRYVRPYRGLLAVSTGLLVVQAGLTVVGPLLTQAALDRAIPAGDADLLLRYAALYVAALLGSFVAEYVDTLVTTRIGQAVMSDIRNAVFAHLQRLSIPFFDRNPVGRLMTRVTADVETLNELFSSGVVAVFGDLFTLLAIAGVMIWTDWQLALVSFLAMPLLWLVVTAFRRAVREAFREIRLRVARMNAYLQEQLAGMRVIHLFNREAASAAGFERVNRAHLDAHLRSINLYAIFFPAVELVTAIATALILFEGGRRITDLTLSVGVLAAFIQLVRRFFRPLQDLSEKFNLFQGAVASGERVFRLLDTPVTVVEPAAPTRLPQPVRGEVEFDRVWFRYADDGPWALQDVSFRVAAGDTVALVGHTGAGKTTVVNLLLRFHDPTRGRITLDGIDLRELDLDELRSQYGYVQQDLFLFTGDLMRNLALDPTTSEAEVRRAAERVGVADFVESLPGGYGHVLTERGRNVSVGERQLLSFARALARDPAILLLDEATSSVDSATEVVIQNGIAELMAGRTAIVVAHRLSTIQTADEILVMHRGRIAERGTHRALLARDGVYRRLSAVGLG
ncbi:MAG: ABC transporter ATP-binding protein [Gemmatimonadales bacterium]